MSKPNAVLLALVLSANALSAGAQDIDPRGIYFNDFTGSFSGTEWFQVTPTGPGSTTYRIADLYGGGFVGTITPNGTVTIPGGNPTGSFSDADNFEIFPFGGAFTFTSNRAPTTTVDFPLMLDSPRPAPSLLAGQWSNTLQFFNPQTGQAQPPGTELITVTTNGNTIRITDPGGLFFQGVFENGLLAGFRVLNNPSFGTPTGDFAPFPGSATNIGQDLLGELNLIDINTLRASFLLQTRTPLGNQSQQLVEFNATRVNPLAAGDANGDGNVDAADEAIVASLVGLTFEDDTYELAADVDANGVIDGDDLAFLTGEFIDVGNALAGTFAPSLAGSGSLAANGSFTLSIAGAPVSTTGFLFVGFSDVNLPFRGGILVPDPTILVEYPTSPVAFDVFDFVAGLLPGVPSATSLFLQAWYADAGGPAGASATNALQLITP